MKLKKYLCKNILDVSQFDYWCKELIEEILTNGKANEDRTGIGTKSVFSYQVDVDVSKSIPITTLKSTPFKNTIRELLWFINGSSSIKHLHSKVKSWWEPWVDKKGDVGDMYGYILRKYSLYNKLENMVFIGTAPNVKTQIDQFKNVIDSLIHTPHSRRHVISLWNPDIESMALANCHGTVIQFYVTEDNKLNMYTHQRSMDLMLGGFVNFTSYAIFLHIVAKLTGYKANIMTYSIGDCHIYNSHIEAAEEVLTREPIDCDRRLIVDPELDFESLHYNLSLKGHQLDKDIDRVVNMFTLLDYQSHKGIKLPIAV